MEEILASIRRIIADEQTAAEAAARPGPSVQDAPPQSSAGAEGAHGRSDPVLRGAHEFEAWLAQTANLAAAPVDQPPAAPEFAAVGAVDAHAHAGAYPNDLEGVALHAASPAGASEQWAESPPAAWPAPPPEPAPAPWQPPRLSVVPPRSAAQQEPAQPDVDLDAPLSPAADAGDLLSEAAGASVQSSFQALARTMFMQNTGMVEEAVREMLRPMLKQWLDDNLPVMVERLVRAEIERVARGGR